MRQLTGIACSLLMLLLLVACKMLDETVAPNPLAPDRALGKISEGAGGQGEGVAGKSVSTDDIFPPKKDVNGEVPREAPIGVEEDFNQLKQQPPVSSEGPAEEDKAEED